MVLDLVVNGVIHTVEVEPGTPLLWVLRDSLRLTGTKYGCGLGLCGVCTVHLDGRAVRSCQVSVDDVGTRAITTIEGLEVDADHPLGRAWIDHSVVQCGYCQAGQIMAAAALLAASDGLPPEAEIGATMSEILCRCGTYQRIRAAIEQAAEAMR
jgi:aerobic-type carbon monoxide dehydrogenase small subunit (CoxS/CutS family)